MIKNMQGKVKLVAIKHGKRPAGWSYVNPPPEEYIGRIGVINRELINSDIPCYWVHFPDNKDFVLAEDEIEEVK